jgi:arginine:ornithine antiporter/lysine permease
MKNLADSFASPSAPRPATRIAAGAAKALRLGLLTALVIGSMIGSGVFSLPQNMASGAGAAAVLTGWLITGVGMLMLAFVSPRSKARC